MEGTAAPDVEEVVLVRDLIHVTGSGLHTRRATIETTGREVHECP